MSDPTNIPQIAAGLTIAQRTALHNLSFVAGWQLAPHDGWRRAGQACTNLCRKGLAAKRVSYNSEYCLTPLGQAVRQYLKEQEG